MFGLLFLFWFPWKPLATRVNNVSMCNAHFLRGANNVSMDDIHFLRGPQLEAVNVQPSLPKVVVSSELSM